MYRGWMFGVPEAWRGSDMESFRQLYAKMVDTRQQYEDGDISEETFKTRMERLNQDEAELNNYLNRR